MKLNHLERLLMINPLRPLFLNHLESRRLLDHPQEDRFDLEDFRSELTTTGFRIVGSRQLSNLFGWVVADKAGT